MLFDTKHDSDEVICKSHQVIMLHIFTFLWDKWFQVDTGIKV